MTRLDNSRSTDSARWRFRTRSALQAVSRRTRDAARPLTALVVTGLGLSLPFGASLAAQTGGPDPLAPLIAEALERNPGLEQARLLERRAAEAVGEARGRWLPSLSLEGRFSEQSGALDLGDLVNPAYAALNQLSGSARFPTDLSVTVPFRHETRFRLVQPVFDERIRGASALARAQYAIERAGRAGEARSLAAAVQVAWYRAAAARDAVGIMAATLDVVVENERVAKRLVAAGEATPEVRHRARAERARVEQRLAETREAALAAVRDLNRLLDRPLDARLDPLTDAATASARPMPASADDLVTRGLGSREEQLQADAGIEAAHAGVRLATSSFVPRVSLALDYGWQGRDVSFGRSNDFAAASVVLSWGISPVSDAARREGAQLDERRARVRRHEVETLIELEIRQAYESATVARTAIGTAEAQRTSAERAFEFVQRRYEEGLASQVEFIDARTAMTSAQLDHSIACWRYAIALVELERAAALRPLNDMAER